MEKEIDVIIPAYDSHKTLATAIASVLAQSISDQVKITVVNDGGASYEDIIQRFEPFIDIVEIGYQSNKGPGVARQFGIEHTSAPFLIFLDSDDTLGDCFSLEVLLKEIKKDDMDIVNGIFIEEASDGTGSYFFHEDDQTWMHGKMYRRKFLEDINLRFSDLRKNEDAAFNMVAFNLTKKHRNVKQAAYFWHGRKGSVSRTNDYHINGYEGWCKGTVLAFEYLETYYKEGSLELESLLQVAANAMILLYLEYNWFMQTREPKLVNKYLRWVKEVYDKVYIPYSRYISDQIFTDYYNLYQRKNIRTCALFIPMIGFGEFLQKLQNLPSIVK